jgi:hypothetical protein
MVCNRILSEGAKSVILEGAKRGAFNDRANATDPADMAPSVNPNDYSHVSVVHLCVSESYSQTEVVFVL